MSTAYEVFLAARPWSFTTSVFPVLLAAAATRGTQSEDGADDTSGWQSPRMVTAVLFVAVLVHTAANLANTYFDFRDGVDRPETASDRTLVDGKLSKASVAAAAAASLLAALLLAYVTLEPHPLLSIVWGAGLLLSLSYSAPPLQLKYRGLGDIVTMLCFGPILMQGTALALTGKVSIDVFWLSVPIALATETIMFANNTRDIESDKVAGIITVCQLLGFERCKDVYGALEALMYASVFVISMRALNFWYLFLPSLTLPITVDNIRLFVNDPAIMRDSPERNAQFHMLFCLCLTVATYLS
ncbi:UbiA prenyltransferase domain-containing protein 1-like [Hondaea fermentalgiana]|uniref:UbiA prenyltransferase domain-containing protein 1-like n=1 Tax=Hondaea fermentalgiana TaxID=2315210 RepID=A0A2R5GDQ3_9STRA|nr:UbiA prenyltransferase domain-containing protein 1-like [Hondaea fermentalgiana]|eukprot:GBG27848.1 UbiA prenyltransferase domain-containing protein 1-like [Hondaea fermentalgiana]